MVGLSLIEARATNYALYGLPNPSYFNPHSLYRELLAESAGFDNPARAFIKLLRFR